MVVRVSEKRRGRLYLLYLRMTADALKRAGRPSVLQFVVPGARRNMAICFILNLNEGDAPIRGRRS
jgi:hypothetical protein